MRGVDEVRDGRQQNEGIGAVTFSQSDFTAAETLVRRQEGASAELMRNEPIDAVERDVGRSERHAE